MHAALRIPGAAAARFGLFLSLQFSLHDRRDLHPRGTEIMAHSLARSLARSPCPPATSTAGKVLSVGHGVQDSTAQRKWLHSKSSMSAGHGGIRIHYCSFLLLTIVIIVIAQLAAAVRQSVHPG